MPCGQGKLGRVRRRLHDAERRQIRSGSVFVFDEAESGIRRWTDGRLWSPSRIHGNFLVYRELEKRLVSDGKSDSLQEWKEDNEDWLPEIENVENIDPRLLESAPSVPSTTNGDRDEVGLSESLLEKKNRTLLNSQRPNSSRYVFKRDGMVKRTISAKVDGHWQHLVCYYSRAHFCTVLTGGPPVDTLFDVNLMAELRSVRVPIDLVIQQNFRRPPMLTTAMGSKEVPLPSAMPPSTAAPRPRRDSQLSSSSTTSNTPIPILADSASSDSLTADPTADDLIISECVERVNAMLNGGGGREPISRYSLIMDHREPVEEDGEPDQERWFLRGDPSMPLME